MADIELIRVTDADAAAPAIALGRVYMDWLVEQVAEHCGVRLTAAEVEQLHADLIAEGPHLLVDPGRVYLGRVNGEPAAIGVLKPVGDGIGELKRIYVTRPTAATTSAASSSSACSTTPARSATRSSGSRRSRS